MSGFDHWNATLMNGEKVKINDYVYVAPPWSERDGAPYSVARIIEFVPSSAARNSNSKKSTEKHARLALFYRPSEISGRAASDHRLLFAAIHSEVHPVSWLRGKCFVRHREKIESLQEWKKLPDHFHFLKLFDPYIKREYEMVRTVSVNNIPAHVKKVLVDRYEFLVTEKEMVTDLMEGYRTCRTCEKWASSQESVRCEVCKFYYHMSCVNPPLLAKPAKGYSWVCSPCTHHRESSRAGAQYGTSTGVNGVAPPVRAPTRAQLKKEKERKMEPDYDKPDRFYRGWNFRYFGQYTVAEDTTDPDDPIFPRSATRVGSKFQAVVPTWEEQLEINKVDARPEDAPTDLPIRGTDTSGKYRTGRLWSRPSEQVGPFMKDVRKIPLPLQPFDLEVYARALYLCNTHGPRTALDGMASSSLQDFKHLKEFTPTEVTVFETEFAKWGFLENHETAKAVGRKPNEIVRFFYAWRNEQLREEYKQIRISHNAKVGADIHDRKAAKPKKGVRRKIAAGLAVGAAAGMAHQREEDGDEDSEVEGSVYGDHELVDPGLKPSCGVCNAKTTTNWWKAPRTLSGNYLCDACGTSFRKYGVAIPNKYEMLRSDPKKIEKRDGTPLSAPAAKKQKNNQAEPIVLPAPTNPGTAKPPPCALCRRTELKVMARCKNCAFSMHAGCYGIPPEDVGPDWMCEPCANEVSLEVALRPKCVLCPKVLPPLTRPTKKVGATYDFDFLHALKPTEGYKWAHILCSLFIPEVVYSDAKRLRVAEGISALPKEKWLGACSVCHQTGGAVITCAHQMCAGSNRQAHAACAWLAGWKFNFDLLVPNRKMTFPCPPLIFGSESRHMVPKCWCDQYEPDSRDLLELFATEPNIGLSAIQLYAQNYKKSFEADSFPLLRKAARLESLMPEPITRQVSPDEYSLAKRPTCQDCGAKGSPKWYDADPAEGQENGEAMEVDTPAAPPPMTNGLTVPGVTEKPTSSNGEELMVDEELIGLALPAVSRRSTSSRALTPREDNGSVGGGGGAKICHQCNWERRRRERERSD